MKFVVLGFLWFNFYLSVAVSSSHGDDRSYNEFGERHTLALEEDVSFWRMTMDLSLNSMMSLPPSPTQAPSNYPSEFRPTPSPTTTSAPSEPCRNGVLPEQVLGILQNVSDPVLLETTGTHQNSAYQWLIEDDSILSTCPSVAALIQRYILAVFFYANEENGHLDFTWLDPDTHECDWDYIFCDDSTHRWVETLRVTGRGLTGTIPSELGTLESLRNLSLYGNFMVGSIPGTLGNLPHLEQLHLDNNRLRGTLPSTLGSWKSLQYLFVSYNYLSGSIPTDVRGGLYSSLTQLNLSYNRLTGTIPYSLGRCFNLYSLHLHQNSLTGTIPLALFQGALGTSLKILALNDNALSGTLPDFSTSGLAALTSLYLHNNVLSGKVPLTLEYMTSLVTLQLGSNSFSGIIPSTSNSLTDLEFLGLYDNTLSGTIPEVAFPTSLRYLRLHSNQLVGSLPSTLGLLTALTQLYVHDNPGLEAPVPAEVCSLPNEALDLQTDWCTGSSECCSS